MATISTLNIEGTTHMTMFDGMKVYVAENVIDFADVLAAKGSALAAADVIEAITVPAGTYILGAGIQTVAVDDATTLTLDVGITGGDVDQWVDGYDQAAAAVGAFSTLPATAAPGLFGMVGATADTIDVLFATLTGTLTVGKIRVWALLAEVGGLDKRNPGLVVLGS